MSLKIGARGEICFLVFNFPFQSIDVYSRWNDENGCIQLNSETPFFQSYLCTFLYTFNKLIM